MLISLCSVSLLWSKWVVLSCASKFQTSTHPRKQQLFQEGSCEEQHQASMIHSRCIFYAIFFFLQPLISLYWTFREIRTRARKAWGYQSFYHRCITFCSPWSYFIQILIEIRHFTEVCVQYISTTAQDDHSVCTDTKESHYCSTWRPKAINKGEGGKWGQTALREKDRDREGGEERRHLVKREARVKRGNEKRREASTAERRGIKPIGFPVQGSYFKKMRCRRGSCFASSVSCKSCNFGDFVEKL